MEFKKRYESNTLTGIIAERSGISIDEFLHTTSAGWRGLGSPVSSLTDAQAGDIICYQGHVAIYDGTGMIVEAKGSKWGITHDRAANCRPILAIRRFTTD